MNCPVCNGPLAMLFTSTYCPACDEREAEPRVSPAQVATPAVRGCLFVGDDGELWWSHNGMSMRIT